MTEAESHAAELREAVRREGFAVVPRALSEERVAALARALDAVAPEDPSAMSRGGVYALRNLLEVVPAVREFAASREARALVAPVLGSDCFPVRGTLFDKTPEARWKVAWHQDLSIAVKERREVEGFGPWSVKAGVVHVQPPADVLEGVLALRLHLDDCDEENGALCVCPGSHAFGRLSRASIEELLRAARGVVCCAVPRGGVLLMRPLLLHSSPTPRVARRRRVIHLEFAARGLPDGLRWRA